MRFNPYSATILIATEEWWVNVFIAGSVSILTLQPFSLQLARQLTRIADAVEFQSLLCNHSHCNTAVWGVGYYYLWFQSLLCNHSHCNLIKDTGGHADAHVSILTLQPFSLQLVGAHHWGYSVGVSILTLQPFSLQLCANGWTNSHWRVSILTLQPFSLQPYTRQHPGLTVVVSILTLQPFSLQHKSVSRWLNFTKGFQSLLCNHSHCNCMHSTSLKHYNLIWRFREPLK